MPSPLHPLTTDIAPPERFTYPFCYEPHPLCLLAAEEVKQEIERIQPSEGKMFGVLVVEGATVNCKPSTVNCKPSTVNCKPSTVNYSFLAAYSGLLEGRNDWSYFVPPVYDAQDPNGYFKTREREISDHVRGYGGTGVRGCENTPEADKKDSSGVDGNLAPPHPRTPVPPNFSPPIPPNTKQMSQDLQLWLFHQYQFLNARGETKDLVDVWQDYHCSPRIRRRFPLPPGGTGDCCAPKLLQYAFMNGLKPLCMAEFWWGPSPKGMIRHHGQFYPACRGKCKPVLTWMLQGLDVDPSPDENGFPHLEPEVVYEDEVMAVINKPAGLLSVPGRTEDFSVATWTQLRWPGSKPVHRLDMWTQGIILIAKTNDAYHALQKQFTERTIKKKYLALVEGVPAKEHGIIDLPLLCDPMNRPRQVVDFERGKRAITEYRVLTSPDLPKGEEYLPELTTAGTPLLWRGRGRFTLLALWPHTGRTHQLRMHCAHPDGLGCPIVGDELYGTKADRLCLQAQAITFVHPATGRKMHFELSPAFHL